MKTMHEGAPARAETVAGAARLGYQLPEKSKDGSGA